MRICIAEAKLFLSVISLAVIFLSFAASTPALAQTAYYVATNGHDSWDGRAPSWNGHDGPFATLRRAQLAMETSSIKTTYIRSGTYYPASIGDPCNLRQNHGGEGLMLTASRDNGETWAGYPGDRPLSAVIDGRSTSSSRGLTAGVCVGGSFTSPVTFTNLKWQHFDLAAIYAVSPVIVTDSEFTQWSWIQGTAMSGAAVLASGYTKRMTSGYQIKNNYFHDSYGMAVILVPRTIGAVSNSTISNNAIINTCASPNRSITVFAGDCGAIYTNNTLINGASSNIQIKYNYIRNVYSVGGGVFSGRTAGAGIYLDNAADNVSISGNVLTGIMSIGFLNHGGSNNHFTDNIYDESNISSSSSGSPYIFADQRVGVYYETSNTGNTFTDNIIVSRGAYGGGGYRGFSGVRVSPTIENNMYHNYASSAINSAGAGGVHSDSRPIYENPQLCGWTYNVVAGSPAHGTPVSFPAQPSDWGKPGFWGPPGFVIPQTGTSPSVPLTCN